MSGMFLLQETDDWDDNSFPTAVFTSVDNAQAHLTRHYGPGVVLKRLSNWDAYSARVDHADDDGYGRHFYLRPIEADPE